MSSHFLSESENVVSGCNIPRALTSPKSSDKDSVLRSPSTNLFNTNSKSPSIIDLSAIGSVSPSFINLCDSVADANSLCVDQPASPAPEEIPEERLAREERESQELAWQLMQQDNMEMYNLQLQYMQENANQLDNDDFQLIQSFMHEAGQQITLGVPPAAGGEEVQSEGGEQEETEEDSDTSNWDYERLLQLGQQLGGKGEPLLTCLEIYTYCMRVSVCAGRCENGALAPQV
jgi:hypothetical protein